MNSFTVSLIAVLACAVGVSALSCLPCHKVTCRKPMCKAGVTVIKGICGCCSVCSQQLYQKCGGLWGTDGRCDPKKSLVCVKRPICHQYTQRPADPIAIQQTTGVCTKKYDVVTVCRMCQSFGMVCPNVYMQMTGA